MSSLPSNSSQLLPASPLEAEEIATFVNQAYRGDESKKGWTTEAHLLDGQRTDAADIREKINLPLEGIFLLRNEKKELLGSVYLKKASEDTAYLGMLSVGPNQQSLGTGKKILELSEKISKEYWNSKKIKMTVIEERLELIEYYQRRGYEKTGEIEPFPMNNRRFGIPKVPFIQMIVLEKKIL